MCSIMRSQRGPVVGSSISGLGADFARVAGMTVTAITAARSSRLVMVASIVDERPRVRLGQFSEQFLHGRQLPLTRLPVGPLVLP